MIRYCGSGNKFLGEIKNTKINNKQIGICF